MAEKQYLIEYTTVDELLRAYSKGTAPITNIIVVSESSNVLETAKEMVEENKIIILSINQARVCPICEKVYTDYPATSRKDNKTEICPDCGTEEAIKSFNYWSHL